MNRKNTLLKIVMLTLAAIFSIALTVAASAERGAAAAQGGIAVNDENFPDPAFREYILTNINTSEGDLGEGEEILTETEIAEVYYIEIWYDDITSLKGIEHFTALEGLFCYGNELTELDLTGNTSLIDLSCAYNKLTSLKLPESLQNLDASNNRLTELDLASLPSLSYVSLDYNQFTSIDLSGNKMLSYLSIDGNRLTSLDMTGVGSETEQGNFYSVTAENNIHKIELTDNTFDLAGMPEGFDLTKVRSFGNATLEGSVITVTDPESRISYEYYIGTSYYEEEYVTFYLTDKDPIISGFEFKTDDPDFFLPIAGESTYRDSEEYFDAFSRGTDFELIDAYWCDMTNGDPEGEFFTDLYEEGYSFKGDTVYQLCLDFKTDGYFTFSEENLSNYQVNGLSPAEIFFYDSESFGLAYNMPVTAALALTEIGEIELTVSEDILPDPVAGELAFRDEEAIRAVFEGTDIVYGTYYWGDGSATCTAFAICESCDKPYGNKAEHKGGSASCTAEAVCEVCNNPYGASLGHKYTINGQDKNAHWKRCETCSAVTDREEHGYIDDICSVCSYEREAPPIDNTPKDPTPENTDNTVSPNEDNEGLTGAQIAAIAVGSASGLGGGGFALYWFLIRRRRLGK